MRTTESLDYIDELASKLAETANENGFEALAYLFTIADLETRKLTDVVPGNQFGGIQRDNGGAIRSESERACSTKGAGKMDQDKETNAKDIGIPDPWQRELIIAYLSYALDDVRALGGIGPQLLQMTIEAIAENPAADDSNRALQSTQVH
jgi:hypothetical protein